MKDKQALREAMRGSRRALPKAQQEKAARDAAARLYGFAPYMKAKTVMAYIACQGELSLAPVIDDALRSGKTLLLPRCDAPGVITARRVMRLSQMSPGAYGLMEPEAGSEVFPPEEIDLILVPGTAFDAGGGRLGQGGGYYDRFLEKTGALRVGVCHAFALQKSVPAEAHDARMDYILTPQAVIRCGGTTSDDRRA